MRQLKITKSITDRISEPALDKYLQDIAKFKLFTTEQEVEVAQRIQEGDDDATLELVNANLRFVVSVAKQYKRQSGMPLLDLINEGNLGLIKAAEKFDPTRGFKFISYAVWWIRQSIMASLNEHSRTVRLPLNQLAVLTKINVEIKECLEEKGVIPPLDKIADKLGIAESKIRHIYNVGQSTYSLDLNFGDNDDNGSLMDILENPNSDKSDKGSISKSLNSDLKRVLASLSEREEEILTKAYGLDGEEVELGIIADEMGLTRERVRQIKAKAILKLQTNKRREVLKEYLD